MTPFLFAHPSPSFDFCCVPGGYMTAQLWLGLRTDAISPPSGTHPVQAAAGCYPVHGRYCLSCSADGWSPSRCLAVGLEPGQDAPSAESIFSPKVSQQLPVHQLLCCFSPVLGVLQAAWGSTARASHLASTFPPPISQPPSLHPHAPA